MRGVKEWYRRLPALAPGVAGDASMERKESRGVRCDNPPKRSVIVSNVDVRIVSLEHTL